MLLVGASMPKEKEDKGESLSDSGSVPVSLVMVSVPIEYRIADIYKYLYNYSDPAKIMEGVAYRYLSEYAARVDIDTLMGPGREAFNAELKELIRKRLDELDLGIEIVFCGIRGAHPPVDAQVAATFQQVVAAEMNMAATINAARGEARRLLIEAAGTESRAMALDEVLRARDELRKLSADASEENRLAAEQAVDDLLMGAPEKRIIPISGEAAAMIADARVEASRKTSDAASKVLAFSAELAAFEAAPDLYKKRKILEVYQYMGPIRKFLIVGDPSNILIEYETRREASLDTVLQESAKE